MRSLRDNSNVEKELENLEEIFVENEYNKEIVLNYISKI